MNHDFMFTNNKYEKSNYGLLGLLFKELYDEIHSDKMIQFLSYIFAKDFLLIQNFWRWFASRKFKKSF